MAKHLRKFFKASHPVLLPALLLSPLSALAAGNYFDARNDAMGGIGVATSNYGTAALANPALLTKAQPDDDVSITLPSVGAQLSDKDHMISKIDDLRDSVDHYRDLANQNPLALLRNYQQVKAAAGDLANQLEKLRDNKAWGSAGAAVVVAVPNQTLPFAFVTKAYGTAHIAADVAQSDIDYLHGIENGTRIPLPGDQNNLRSAGLGRGAIVYDYGLAMAHQFSVGGHLVSVGVTPKIQQVYLYNYSASIYNFDKSDFRKGRFKNHDSGFNLDAGLATDVNDNWSLGLSTQNLISRNIDTREISGFKDTYQLRPVVTGGVAWHNERVTLGLDADATPTKGFKSQQESQYAGIGAEFRVLSWLQLRAGYRADMKSNDANVVTAGIGLSPWGKVHLDLAGMAGNNRTYGAVAQLGFTF